MNIRKNIAFIFFCVILVLKSTGQPNAGGEIIWHQVGKDKFIITLIAYRNCYAIQFSNKEIRIKDTKGNYDTSFYVSPSNELDITPICDQYCSRCDDNNCFFPYGYQRYEYHSGVLDLSHVSPASCKFFIIYADCCMEPLSTIYPNDYSFYYESMFDRCLTHENNSPEFSNHPTFLLCKNQDAFIDPGIINSDYPQRNDSLACELITPRNQYGSSHRYISSFSKNAPVTFLGFPDTDLYYPAGFHFDAKSGAIMFRPTKIERSLIAMKVKKYRNNQLVGFITRYFCITFHDYMPNNVPLITGPISSNVCTGQQMTTQFSTFDSDPDDSLTIKLNYKPQGAGWADSNGISKHPQAWFSWKPESDQVGTYRYTVSVKDNKCLLYGHKTIGFYVGVHPSPEFEKTVQKLSSGRYLFRLESSTGGRIDDIEWSGDGALSSKSFNLIHQYPKPGIYPYKLTCSSGICLESIYDTIITDSFLWTVMPQDTQLCYGDSINLNIQVHDHKGPVKYHWSTGDTTANIIIGPVISDTLVSVILNDSLSVFHGDMCIRLIQGPNVDLGADFRICSDDKKLIKPFIQIDDSAKKATYKWFKNDTSYLISIADSLLVQDSALYIFQIKDDLGCSGSDSVRVLLNPHIEAIVPKDQSVCKFDSLIFSAGKTGGSYTKYEWFLGDSLIYRGQNLQMIALKNAYITLKTSETTGLLNCSDSAGFYLSVNDLPLVNAGDNDTLCSESGKYLLPGNSGNLIYLWEGPGVVQEMGGFYFDTDHNLVKSGGYFVLRLEVKDSNTCSNSDERSIRVYNTPVPDAGYYPELCANDPIIKLQGTPKGGRWTGEGMEPGNYFDPGKGQGSYYFTYIVFSNGVYCPKSDMAEIEVHPLTIPRFAADPRQGTAPLQVSFSQRSIGNISLLHTFWDMGDGHQRNEAGDFIYTYHEAGDYDVQLYLLSEEGCMTEISKTNYIHVDEPSGMNEVTRKDFYIAPNPASEVAYLYVQNPDIEELVICNSLGQELKRIDVQGAGTYEVRKAELGRGVF